jgi:hypothetical protein
VRSRKIRLGWQYLLRQPYSLVVVRIPAVFSLRAICICRQIAKKLEELSRLAYE